MGAVFFIGFGGPSGSVNGLLVTDLTTLIGTQDKQVVETVGYYAEGDGGGGSFYWDAGSVVVANGGTIFGSSGNGRWFRRYSGCINLRWFGATGVFSQTLYACTPYSPIGGGVFITQQTIDAIAINNAFAYIKGLGGGTLFIPSGIYAIDRCLARIDFPIKIQGEGPSVSIFKSTNIASDTVHSGILYVDTRSGELGSCIILEDLALNGNGEVRAAPAEGLTHLFTCYGEQKIYFKNIQMLSSTMDCLYTNYGNSENGLLQAVNCLFSKARRNTVSIISGCNQQYTNCVIEKGGRIYAPLSPQAGIDIEPDYVSTTDVLKNIQFNNCIFKDSLGITAQGTRAEASFSNCLFERNNTDGTLPWIGYWAWGQYTFSGCVFTAIGNFGVSFRVGEEEVRVDQPFINRQFVNIFSSSFEGSGLISGSPSLILQDTVFRNSSQPVMVNFGGSTANHSYSAILKNVTLINIVDVANTSQVNSAFAIAATSITDSYVEIDGLSIYFSPSELPADYASFFAAGVNPVYGININTAFAATQKISNVHVAGYYQKYPNVFGYVLGANYRDWRNPATAPADTAGNTTTPGATYYRNCTMYGNSP